MTQGAGSLGGQVHVPVLGMGEWVRGGPQSPVTSEGAPLGLRPHTPLSLNPASCIPVRGCLVPSLTPVSRRQPWFPGDRKEAQATLVL